MTSYDLGKSRQLSRIYNFVNNLDGGLGPVYFTDYYILNKNNTPPTPPTPPNFYTANCDALINYYKQLITYENTLIGIDTVFNKIYDPYNRPYIELLYPDNITQNFITYISLNDNNYVFTIVADELELETDVIASEQRCFVYNDAYIVPVSLENYPQIKNLKIKGTNLYQQMKIAISVPFGEPPKFYQEMKVYRSSIYIYNSGTNVYVISDTINKKIYVMQSYTFKHYPQSNLTSLYLLREKLVNMPEGFTYCILTVKPNTCLIAVTTITTYPAILISDELDNTYQYLYPEFNPQIYSQFNLLP